MFSLLISLDGVRINFGYCIVGGSYAQHPWDAEELKHRMKQNICVFSSFKLTSHFKL